MRKPISMLRAMAPEEAIALARRLSPRAIALDLENTALPVGAGIAESLDRDLLRQLAEIAPVTIVSNRRLTPAEIETIAVPVIDDAGKPRVRTPQSWDLVVGDQLSTDGLMAWRSRADFVWARWHGTTLPWPTRMAEGLLSQPLVFRRFWRHG